MEIMRSKKYIIGCGDFLERALSDWGELDTDDHLIGIEMGLQGDYKFDLTPIGQLVPSNATAFIAWGSDFMNFQRLELFMELKKIGFKMPALISQRAFISRDVKISENAYINSGVQINNGVSVGINTVIMSGVILESNVQVGNSCFIDSRTLCKERVKIDENCIIGSSSQLFDSVNIGRCSFIDSGSKILANVQANSYFSKQAEAKIV